MKNGCVFFVIIKFERICCRRWVLICGVWVEVEWNGFILGYEI